MTDFTVENHGSIFLLTPQTDAAQEWAAEHLPHDVMSWGKALVVEHRYIGDVVDGIRAEGLTIE